MKASREAVFNPVVIDSASAVGPLVRQRRREQALRIDDAASLTGVSVDLFSRLENGKGAVRLDKLLAVLDGLGLTMVVGPKEHPWVLALPADVVDADGAGKP
ncbi:MAG: transcriptional regulator [Rhizobacter sp.]|nr:transcriptional regulator [Rhizobacter sp.]